MTVVHFLFNCINTIHNEKEFRFFNISESYSRHWKTCQATYVILIGSVKSADYLLQTGFEMQARYKMQAAADWV